VADVAEPELTTAVREAVAHQLLVQDAEQDAYAFRHALLAESILGDLLPGERTRLHLALAEALASDPRLAAEPGNAAAELAFHWRACHRLDEALAASIEAGVQAESRLAFAEANRHFENALELWDRVEEAERRAGMDRAAVSIRAAQNASLNGGAHRAVALARSAVDELDPQADLARAALARERLGEFLWLAGESDDAARILREAVDLLPGEPSVERAQVLAADARLLMLHGRPQDSAAMCEEAISIARDSEARDVEGHALNTLGCDLLCLGDRQRAIAHLSDAKRIAEECSPEDLWRAYSNLGEALEQDGRLDDAVALGLEGAELVRPLGQRNWGAYILGMVASPLVRLGRLDEAEELVASGLDALIEGIDTAILKSVSAEISLLRGDPERAQAELADALRAAGATTDWMIRSMLIDRQVLLAVHAGDVDRAATVVAEAIGSMDDGEYVFYTARTYALGVRAHADRAERARALGDTRTAAEAERSAAALVERIERLLEPDRWLDSPPPESVARGALAVAELKRATGDATPEAWDSVARYWAELGFALELAYCRWRQAEAALSAAGAKADATDALREAAQLVEQSGASALRTEIGALARRARIDLGGDLATAAPEPMDPELDRFGLTDRELDVLALLVEGRTNPEIAETLFISRKTASAHVSHILTKLEVRSRVEAATLAHRLGLVAEKSG
jgi:ATP/maltotriose-dependent transcriptional regulator MalT